MRPYARGRRRSIHHGECFALVPERFVFGHTDARLAALLGSARDEGDRTVDRIEVVREVRAAPEVVWELVADLPRMGEWSPENNGGTWIRGANGPVPGAKFKGRNANGSNRWSTTVKVVDAIPGERFSFVVTVGPFKIAEWSFDIEPTKRGCRVIEIWEDQRSGFMKQLGAKASGVEDRAAHNRAGMKQTLEGIAAAAESAST